MASSTRFSTDFYPPALTSGNDAGAVPRIAPNFYPPALTSGNFCSLSIRYSITFLSTRSHEREPFGIAVNFALIEFLSTRSHERELQDALSRGADEISIHPLSRAGTLCRCRVVGVPHFYPPALTSGNCVAVLATVTILISIHPLSRAGTKGVCIIRCNITISIHPLSRAGTQTH